MWSRLGLSSPVRCKGYKETTTDQGHAKQVLLPKVNYKIKRERYRKEITTNLLIKSKVDRVQKAARPATQRSQLSPEHFPWRPQLKLVYINQSRFHLSVHQSCSQCLQTCKYGYNTLHGACRSQRHLRSPATVRDPESLTAPWLWFPENASISRWLGS